VIFFLSVDGIDAPTNEHNHFEKSRPHSSHKFGKKAGFTYELGLAIWRKKICWLNGPFPAGKGDLPIYREGLKHMVPPGKKVVADRIYSPESETISAPNCLDTEEVKKFKRRVRARHESCNRLIKNFKCMSTRWRHPKDKHVIFFEACCVVVQYNLDAGDELFDVVQADNTSEDEN
jgi:hypothetical protein